MTEISNINLQDKIAAAFRLVGEDKDFREHAPGDVLALTFEVKDVDVRGIVSVDHGKIFWSTGTGDEANLKVSWRSWHDLERWIDGISPLWWHRLLGRLSMEGQATPVTQECLYLFRNYFKLMMKQR